MECGRADSVSLEDVEDVEDDALVRRRLEVALRGLGCTDGADEFIRLYCDGQPLPPMVDFVESAFDEGFPLVHVIAALRERSRGGVK